MMPHRIASREAWLEARRALLAEEKAWTRERDRLSAMRRALPWVKVEKDYVFAGEDGPVSLADLFDGRSQLVVYHFMFGPDWQEGCVGCSFLCDHVDGARRHFEHHDISFVAVSRAPMERLLAYRERMGWTFRWVSSGGNDFNFDYHVSFPPKEQAAEVEYNFTQRPHPDIDELEGESVFLQAEDGTIYHTYSSYARGDEPVVGAYAWIDMTPRGRIEPERGALTDWVRRHDTYPDDGRTRLAMRKSA